MSKSPAFSGLLRQYMAVKKMTQEQFCEKFTIGKTTLYRLLSDTENTLEIVADTRAIRKFLPKLSKDKAWQRILGASQPEDQVIHNDPESAVSIHEPEPSREPVISAEEEVQRKFGRNGRLTVGDGFRTFVSNAGYVRRNLIVFVREYPAEMPLEERECLKTLFELYLSELTGLFSGEHVMMNNSLHGPEVYERHAPSMHPAVKIKEKYGKPVHKFFDCWADKYVIGRTLAEVINDGVELLVVEPDPTGTKVIDAWYLRGVAPGNTGFSDHARSVIGPLNISDTEYDIPLICGLIEINQRTRDYGQACLDLLGKATSSSLSEGWNPLQDFSVKVK